MVHNCKELTSERLEFMLVENCFASEEGKQGPQSTKEVRV